MVLMGAGEMHWYGPYVGAGCTGLWPMYLVFISLKCYSDPSSGCAAPFDGLGVLRRAPKSKHFANFLEYLRISTELLERTTTKMILSPG